MIGAVELVARKDPPQAFDPKLTVAARVARRSLASGVLTRALPSADTLAFSPPLVISEDEIDTMVNTVREAVDEVQSELLKHGQWKR